MDSGRASAQWSSCKHAATDTSRTVRTTAATLNDYLKIHLKTTAVSLRDLPSVSYLSACPCLCVRPVRACLYLNRCVLNAAETQTQRKGLGCKRLSAQRRSQAPTSRCVGQTEVRQRPSLFTGTFLLIERMMIICPNRPRSNGSETERQVGFS